MNSLESPVCAAGRIALLAAIALLSPLLAFSQAKDAATLAAERKARAERIAKIKDFERRLDENKVSYGLWNNGYCRRYAGYEGRGKTRIDEAEYRAMQKRYIDILLERDAFEPDNAAFLGELVSALLYKGDIAEARKKAERILSIPDAKGHELAGGLFRLAECQLAMGETNLCRKTLSDLVERNIVTRRRHHKYDWSHYARCALAAMEGEFEGMDLDRLPAGNTATPYPEPQKAEYPGGFSPLGEISLGLSGLKADDARVKFLLVKLRRMGIKCAVSQGEAKGDFAFSASVDPAVAEGRRERYVLTVGEDCATLRAGDETGLLWGFVTFLQLMDPERKAVRQAKIDDWPDTARRGFLGAYWPHCMEFTLFNKMNSVNVQHPPVYDDFWSPILVYLTEYLARQFRDLGLELYYGICEYTMYPQLPFAWEDSHEKRLEICCRYAAMGANVYFPFDDSRYPLCPPDLEKFGTGISCDARFVSRLYREVKSRYPSFKMVFCPPFYFGPDGRCNYPENRETYLKSVGENLDPEIDVYWTGPRVKGIVKRPHHTKWYSDLVKRKPIIFQNGTGPHNYVGYIADTTDWNAWHYPGFFENEIAGYQKNSHAPQECCQIATLADCLWNVKGYDKDRSARRGVDQLLGDGMYDILRPGVQVLSYFDKYKYGALNDGILGERLADLEEKVAFASNRWEQAVAKNPKVRRYGRYDDAVKWAGQVAGAVRALPGEYVKKVYEKEAEGCAALAAGEVSFDTAKGDILLTPVELEGTRVAVVAAGRQKRLARVLGGEGWRAGCAAKFDCRAANGYEAVAVVSCAAERGVTPKLRLFVNDVAVGECDVPLGAGFSQVRVPIPRKNLRQTNKLSIQAVGTTEDAVPPEVNVNYVVLKPVQPPPAT